MCAIKNTVKRNLKYQCFVLCLKTYMPIIAPKLPPIAAMKNIFFSLDKKTLML